MTGFLVGIALGFGAYIMIGAIAACAHYDVFREWPRGWQWICYWRDPE